MDTSFMTGYLERLEDLQKNLHQAIAGLPPEALDWAPGPEMNSLAVLLTHTAGSLRYWIGDVALGDPSNRVRAGEFATRGLSGAEILQRLDGVFAYARSALPRLALADLEGAVHQAAGERPVSRGWALLHALDHGYLHLGHAQLTRQLWDGQATARRG